MEKINPDIARALMLKLDAIDTSELEAALHEEALGVLASDPGRVRERLEGLAGQVVELVRAAEAAGVVDFILLQAKRLSWADGGGWVASMPLISEETTG